MGFGQGAPLAHGVTVMEIVALAPFKNAVIVSATEADVELVVTGKSAVVDPGATVTLAGTNAGEPAVHR